MSGSSAGNYVTETPSGSDEDRALDEAAKLVVDQVAFTLSMLSLAVPSQKKALDELIGDVRLLAHREQAARYQAKANNSDAIRQPCPCGSGAKFKQCCYRMRQARDVLVIVHRLDGESKRKGGAN